MDKSQLEAIRARCEAATPAPWIPKRNGRCGTVYYVDSPKWVVASAEKRNAEFIASVRQGIPDLLDYIATLKKELEVLRRNNITC